ncbi:MAG: TetR/AcrR family transcriptional regulator [Mycobacterium sp.]|nr:TetR/AcrR family transcriptional regulator [Mycobacterium sp.]
MTSSAAADEPGSRNRAADPTVQSGVPQRRRRWAKTDATQERILQAATAVFRENGYSAATIGDVVVAAGASIGSIYHHFGGKSELFLAINEQMAAGVATRIDAAGSADMPASFEAQARAYLEAVWAYRDIAVVLAADDVPPGFDRIRREAMRARFQKWVAILDIDASVTGQLMARAVIAVLNESALMVMCCPDADTARPVIDAAVDCLNRLTATATSSPST